MLPRALGNEEVVHLGYRVFDRHGDVFLGDIGGRAGPAVSAVEMHDMGSRRVASHTATMSTSLGVETLVDTSARRLYA
jgi:hypothetical protein